MHSQEVTMKTRMAFTARSFLLRLAWALATIFFVPIFVSTACAGGPRNVAGTSFFDPTATGKPIVWPLGQVTYYTDQGDLSAYLPNASANALVADAFSQWTSISTAALTATRAGQLAEDVSGANVIVNADGSISLPPDIQPTATGTPVGIVYDYDGSVTDALMGSGAGGTSECFSNAVFGGDDNYGASAVYQHALIVINGQCALQSSQRIDVEYRLVRVIGSVLGVGWSQVNPNVITGSPHATADDYAGFPVMHFADPPNCKPITMCYPNPYQLSMDDAASLSRLYPVTAQNLSSFPGKQVFSAVTARIHGTVWFTDTHGNKTQPMQGVNVVARWIDPTTGLPSRRYAATSVSGFLFTGDAGNYITGFNDALGNPLADWGSANQAVEAFFDLAGLHPPNGSSAQYQLSVESLNPTWSSGVGPYSQGPVAPSGIFAPVIVTVATGNDLAQDIVMTSTAQPVAQAASTWTVPAALPPAGDWVGSLTDYGDLDYRLLAAKSNRTLSVTVVALDEFGNASQSKAQPVIGMWAASDPEGTPPPAFTSSAFNQTVFGMTRLDAQVGTSSNFLIGISDIRGDGRPDYHYHAHVLYADSISPARVSVNGGVVTVRGTGFAPGLTASMGSAAATQFAISPGQMLLAAPAQADGTQNLTIADPFSGAASVMTAAITYGAAATDTISLLGNALNSSTSVGTQATYPVTVRVLAADGVTPVSGATVVWSATNSVQLSACGGASSCSVASDQSGSAATFLTPAATGVANISATLAPATYGSSKAVSTTLYAIESASDIGVLTPHLWVAQGASASLPLTARVLSNGIPRNNVTVNFTVVGGAGSLSAASAPSNAGGYATVNLTVTQLATMVQLTACVAPGNAPCQTIYVNPVPLANLRLWPVSGNGQISTGQAFQPIVVRVTDSASPPDLVSAASVLFLTTVMRGTPSGGGNGTTNPGNGAMPTILQVISSTALTDSNGLANIVPSAGGFSAPLEVDVGVAAGNSATLDYPLQLLPPLNSESSGQTPVGFAPLRLRGPVRIVGEKAVEQTQVNDP